MKSLKMIVCSILREHPKETIEEAVRNTAFDILRKDNQRLTFQSDKSLQLREGKLQTKFHNS